MKYLKRGWNRKKGRGNKDILKRGGGGGSWIKVWVLKKGGWGYNPLGTMQEHGAEDYKTP